MFVSSRFGLVRILIILALLVSTASLAQPAYAAAIVVTTTADVIDAAANCVSVTLATLPGPGGLTSLREAVCAANNTPGPDTISFGVNGTFVLTGAANEDNGNSGDLDINDSLTINGNGTSNTLLNGGGIERIFDVFPGVAITFNLSSLTVTGGDTRTNAFKEGGAIYLHNNVTSTFSNIQVINNFSGANGAIESRGVLSISDSLLDGNQTLPAAGSVTAGALHSANALTMYRVTVSNNSVRGEGGGMALTVGAGVVINITNSTINNNTASVTGGGLGNGGGISTTGNQGTINITNSTISGNRADNNGGGAYFVTPGGGTGAVNLNFVTVTNNTADNDNNGAGAGGGLAQNTATLTLNNTIVSGSYNSLPAVRDDISGAVTAGSAYNLVGDGTGMSGISNGVNNNLVGSGGAPIDAKLLALGNNGGTTSTHALDNGSPALEIIPSGANGCGTSVTTDQRALARPGTRNQPANQCELGAWEAQGGDATAVSLASFSARSGGAWLVLAALLVSIAAAFVLRRTG